MIEKILECFLKEIGIGSLLPVLMLLLSGVLFIFVFENKLFIELDFFKILLLASAVACSIFVIEFIIENMNYMLKVKYKKESINITKVFYVPVIVSVLLIYWLILSKAFGIVHSTKECIFYLIWYIILRCVLILSKKIIYWIKKFLFD